MSRELTSCAHERIWAHDLSSRAHNRIAQNPLKGDQIDFEIVNSANCALHPQPQATTWTTWTWITTKIHEYIDTLMHTEIETDTATDDETISSAVKNQMEKQGKGN